MSKRFYLMPPHFGGVKDLTLSKEGLGMVARAFNLRDRRIWVQGQGYVESPCLKKK